MGQKTIGQLKEQFRNGKLVDQEDFSDVFDSYFHKTTRLPQSQVFGLNDALNDKASKEDLNNISSGLIPMGEAVSIDDLQTKPKVNNHSYYVLDQQDENGNYYIFRYDEELGTWVNTKLISYNGDVLRKTYVGVFTPNPRLAGNLTYNNLRGCANVDIKSIESIEFNSTAGSISVYILQKIGGYYKYYTEYSIDAIDGVNTIKVGLTYGNWAVMFRHIEGGAQLRFSAGNDATGYYITKIIPFTDNASISIPEGEINSIVNAHPDYNYLVRIKQGIYLDGFDDYNKELFEKGAYTVTEKIGLTQPAVVPGNPFGSIYVHNVDISGFISQINVIATQAGDIELLWLTKDPINGVYNVEKQTLNCAVGNNIVEKNAQFTGRIATRCRTGKFGYVSNDIGHSLSAISLDTSLDTPTVLDIEKVESGNLPNWNVTTIIDVIQSKVQNNVLYRLSKLESNQQTGSAEIYGIRYFAGGDSITAYSQGYTYANRCADWMLASQYTNLAIGGATWAWRAGTTATDDPVASNDTNVMSNQILKLFKLYDNGQILAPDLITLSAGINDVSRAHAIGSISEEYAKGIDAVNMRTIVGAIRWCVVKLMLKFPDVRIFLITPLHTSVTARTYDKSKPYADAIIESGRRLSVPVIDCMAGCLINEANESRYMQADKLHPKEAGQQMQALFVWNRLKSEYYNAP